MLEASTKAIKISGDEKRTFKFKIPSRLLNENQFHCNFNLVENRSRVIFTSPTVLRFSVVEAIEENELLWYGKRYGLLSMELETSIE